jgi:predicted transport protein
MPLFKVKENQAEKIRVKEFKLEKDIQNLCEKNLDKFFGLRFIASEFTVDNFRIDTLGYDEDSKAFIIIEYKNTKSYSVIDQGYSYLSKLLNNKAEFLLKYIQETGKTINKDDIDWSQSRVYFVSPHFTTYQLESINFKDLPIFLYEIKKYENEIVELDLKTSKKSSASINTISKTNTEQEKVDKEIRVYSEKDHLENIPEKTIELYEKVKEDILELGDNIEIKPTKLYIGFTVEGKIFSDITIKKKKLKVRLNAKQGEIKDPEKIARDMSNTGHWGVGEYEIHLENKNDIYSLMNLIRQSYELNKNS